MVNRLLGTLVALATFSTLTLLGLADTRPAKATTAPIWGMFSAPSSPVPADLCRPASNVKSVVLEFSWSRVEGTQGVFDDAYLDSRAGAANAFRTAGCSVVLSFGIHHAPGWIMSKPNAKYIDNHGQTSSITDLPNLYWNTATGTGTIRTEAQDYISHVLSRIGTNWYAVRAGGGYLGELDFPPCNSGYSNCWYAFDDAAAASDPVPGWKPGNASPNGEAQRFWNWYSAQTVNYQTWIVAAIRTGGYLGLIHMLYPGWGCRSTDITTIIANNLGGTTPSDCYRGMDHAQQVNAVADWSVTVYGTWGDDTRSNAAVFDLHSLAQAHSLRVGYENAGPGSDTKATNLVANCRTVAADWCGYIRYTDPGVSTFEAAIAP